MDIPTVFVSSASLIVGALSAAVGALYLDQRKANERAAARIDKLEKELDEERDARYESAKQALDDQKELTKHWGAIAAVLERQQERRGAR